MIEKIKNNNNNNNENIDSPGGLLQEKHIFPSLDNIEYVLGETSSIDFLPK